MTAAATRMVSGAGTRRNSSPMTLASAIWCRMPKKMKPSGMTSQVASVIAPAAAATRPSRRRKAGQRMPFAWARNRLTPTRSRKDEAIARANSRQPPVSVVPPSR